MKRVLLPASPRPSPHYGYTFWKGSTVNQLLIDEARLAGSRWTKVDPHRQKIKKLSIYLFPLLKSSTGALFKHQYKVYIMRSDGSEYSNRWHVLNPTDVCHRWRHGRYWQYSILALIRLYLPCSNAYSSVGSSLYVKYKLIIGGNSIS